MNNIYKIAKSDVEQRLQKEKMVMKVANVYKHEIVDTCA